MSADNFVGVRPNNDGTYDVFEYGCMSILDEDCMYLKDAVGRPFSTREKALVEAHDVVKRMDICEYGVIELEPTPPQPCGRCYVCINERKVVDDNVQRCTACKEPIAAGEWMVMKDNGTYHNRCEPGRG